VKDIDDITKALAGKFSGLDIEEKKKPPPPSTQPAWRDPSYFRDREDRRRVSYPSDVRRTTAPSDVDRGPKIFPMDRMHLRDTRNNENTRPNRKPVMMLDFEMDELDQMFKTPCKRGWEFSVWLETIGLPPDLNQAHDGVVYGYAARAYLDRKREAHGR
jgi:hypothetical protein